MRTLVRSLILLCLVVWIGGMVFLGAVEAPAAFRSMMPMVSDPALGLRLAGTMVRVSLIRLHDIGMVCGVVLFLLVLIERAARLTRRSIGPQLVLLAAMLALTAYSQFSVIPRMDTLLAQAESTAATPAVTDSARTDFNRLHNLATRMGEVVMVCGLGLIVLYARPEPVE